MASVDAHERPSATSKNMSICHVCGSTNFVTKMMPLSVPRDQPAREVKVTDCKDCDAFISAKH